MSLKIYTYPCNARSWKSTIAAQINGVSVEEVIVEMGKDNKTPEFLKKNPMGKVPTMDTPEGPLFESNAMARYVARASRVGNLYGTSFFHVAKVDQWIDFASNEIAPLLGPIIYPLLYPNWFKEDKKASKAAKADVKKALKVLDAHLADKTFLVGDALTLADIVVACHTAHLMCLVIDTNQRKAFVNFCRYLNTLLHMPAFVNIIGEVEFCKTAYKVGETLPAMGKAPKAAEADAEAEEEEEEDDFDFGDDSSDDEIDLDEVTARKLAEVKAREAAKMAKARSEIIFAVKPFDDETDMAEMEERVRAIEMDGLKWAGSELQAIAFGLQKLVISAYVVDVKVSVDELEDSIRDIDELVQSIDIVSFSKV